MKKINHQTIRKLTITSLVLVFAVALCTILPKSISAKRISSDRELKAKDREDIEYDCQKEKAELGLDRLSKNDACQEFLHDYTNDDYSNTASNFSQIMYAESISGGSDLGEVTSSISMLNAKLYTAAYHSAWTKYAGQTMVGTITKVYYCDVISVKSGQKVSSCTTNLLGKTTQPMTIPANGNSLSEGRWTQENVGIPFTINISSKSGMEDGEKYTINLQIDGKTRINGTEKGYNTNDITNLEFTYKDYSKPPKDLPKDEQKVPEPPKTVTFNATNTIYLYALVSCEPVVTWTEEYKGTEEITDDGETVSSNFVILKKDETSKTVEANVTATISYPETPTVLYGRNVLEMGNGVDWTQVCPEGGTESVQVRQDVTLENGEMKLIEKTSDKASIKAQAKRIIYQRSVVTSCSSESGCTVTIGPLEEFSAQSVVQNVADSAKNFLSALVSAIENLFNNSATCAQEVSSDADTLENILKFTKCLFIETATDGKSITDFLTMFNESVKTASALSGLIQGLIKNWGSNKTFEYAAPSIFIAAYREAEASIGLRVSTEVEFNYAPTTITKTYPANAKQPLYTENETSGSARTEDIYVSNTRTASLLEKATAYRLSYKLNGTESVCNDHTGCDYMIYNKDPEDLYTNLTLARTDGHEIGIEMSFAPTGEKPSDIFKYDALNLDNREPNYPDPSTDEKITIKGDDECAESYSESEKCVAIGEKLDMDDEFNIPQKINISIDGNTESEEQLVGKVGAYFKHPWNYRIYFSGERNGFENGVAFISETGMTFGVTVNNDTNTSYNNREINGTIADYSKYGADEQEGFSTKSPDLSVKLYLKIINDNNIKTEEDLEKAIDDPEEGTRKTYSYPTTFSLVANGGKEEIKIAIDPKDLENVGVGDHVCYYFGVNHTSSTDDNSMYRHSPLEQWQFSKPICATVIALPTMQVEGGSIFSNGGKITTKTIQPSSNGNTFGSWVEYGIVSRGEVYGLASGKGLPNGDKEYNIDTTTSDHPLTITNSDATVIGSGLEQQGGISGLGNVEKINSPISVEKLKTLKGKTNGRYKTISMNERDDNNGKYQYKNVAEINSEENVEGDVCTMVYYANEDMNIKADINSNKNNYPSNCSGNVPQVLVIADGNINIDDTVQNINAWLIAGGTINTCGNLRLGEKINDDNSTHNMDKCGEQLTVNGPIFAKSIELDRTYMNGADTMAEKFDIGESTYFWIYEQAVGDSGYKEAYSKSLAPRL